MRTSRRFFLTGASLLAAAAVAGRASAQDVVGDILKSSTRGNWDDQFDARASDTNKVASTLPIFSQQTVAFTEQAVGRYQNIVSQGGWEPVPATKKLQLGADDPDVVPLRKRLMICGDLPQSAGISTAFDSYVD
jgi:murein L,D-transpeptidase YcbB/YkuD